MQMHTRDPYGGEVDIGVVNNPSFLENIFFYFSHFWVSKCERQILATLQHYTR
jgi:hypothetical protein